MKLLFLYYIGSGKYVVWRAVDGLVTRKRMRWWILWRKCTSGGVRDGGMPYTPGYWKKIPKDRTRWKQKWCWHKRGNVWDMMVMIKRKEHTSPVLTWSRGIWRLIPVVWTYTMSSARPNLSNSLKVNEFTDFDKQWASPTMCGVTWIIGELMNMASVATPGPNYDPMRFWCQSAWRHRALDFLCCQWPCTDCTLDSVSSPCSVLNLHAHVLHGSRRPSSRIDFSVHLMEHWASSSRLRDTRTHSAQPHELVLLFAGSDKCSQIDEILLREKIKKKRRGLITRQEQALWPERFGWRWNCPFCMKKLRKVCGAPWSGPVMKRRMRWLILWRKREYEMMVCHTHKDVERRSRPHFLCGTWWVHVGQTRKTGWRIVKSIFRRVTSTCSSVALLTRMTFTTELRKKRRERLRQEEKDTQRIGSWR